MVGMGGCGGGANGRTLGDGERERRVREASCAERESTDSERESMRARDARESEESWAMVAWASWRSEERRAHAWPSEVASARVCKKAV
jgi:hypothetical protein